jgi:hypothetical protein
MKDYKNRTTKKHNPTTDGHTLLFVAFWVMMVLGMTIVSYL